MVYGNRILKGVPSLKPPAFGTWEMTPAWDAVTPSCASGFPGAVLMAAAQGEEAKGKFPDNVH